MDSRALIHNIQTESTRKTKTKIFYALNDKIHMRLTLFLISMNTNSIALKLRYLNLIAPRLNMNEMRLNYTILV